MDAPTKEGEHEPTEPYRNKPSRPVHRSIKVIQDRESGLHYVTVIYTSLPSRFGMNGLLDA